MAKKAEAVHISYHTIVKNMHVNKNAKYLSHTNSNSIKKSMFFCNVYLHGPRNALSFAHCFQKNVTPCVLRPINEYISIPSRYFTSTKIYFNFWCVCFRINLKLTPWNKLNLFLFVYKFFFALLFLFNVVKQKFNLSNLTRIKKLDWDCMAFCVNLSFVVGEKTLLSPKIFFIKLTDVLKSK